ncbi:MAG: hypothetical protein ACYCUI_07125 [Vulcanimicrobiaceae bacterium]
MSGSFQTPNTLQILRRVPGATGPTGNDEYTVQTIYAALPALVDSLPRAMGALGYTIQGGEVVPQTDYAYVDGLLPRWFPGVAPGGNVVVKGITYVVAANGRGAYPDIRAFDVVIREDGTRYLVLQTTFYYEAYPSLALHLNFGRAWQ